MRHHGFVRTEVAGRRRRMILPSARCSITCAAQPVVRAMTKSGVNIAVSTPIRL